MEFLRDLFGGGTLTYDQLTAAAREKGYQVVNAAGGAYVPKADADNLQSQVATLTGQLADANKNWKDMIRAGRIKLRKHRSNWKPSSLTLPWKSSCCYASSQRQSRYGAAGSG